MSRNWKRAIQLEVGSSSTKLDLSNLRVRFLVRQWTTQALNAAEFRVYNLAKTTAKELTGDQSEFKNISLIAGYEGNAGRIYSGNIIKSQDGRETPTETFVDFFCRDGDKAYNWGVVNKTFAAGSTQRDHIDEILRVLKPYGITEGTIKGLSEKKYPRAVSMYGMARTFLRIIGHSNEATWSIQNGRLNHVPNSDKGSDSNFVLNANTGLIGMPQETQQGIIVNALINPSFKVNGKVTINEKSIQRAPWQLNYNGDVQNAQLATLGTKDGVYRIIGIEWRGDTHGNEWNATLTCIGAKTGAIPTGQTGLVAPSTGN